MRIICAPQNVISIHVKGCGRCRPPLLTPAGRSTYIVICIIIITILSVIVVSARGKSVYILLYELMTCGTRERDLVIEWEEHGERERYDCAEWLKQDKLEWCKMDGYTSQAIDWRCRGGGCRGILTCQRGPDGINAEPFCTRT